MIGNLIVRREVKSRCQEKYEYEKNRDSTVREICALGTKLFKMQCNSIFRYNYIKDNCDDWQSHLQRISDFLSFGENSWWKTTEFGIEFFDVTDVPKVNCHPKVHHFRSSNAISVTEELEKIGVIF